MRFVEEQGLSDEEVDLLHYFLRESSAYSSQHWEPGNCYRCATSIFLAVVNEEISLPDDVRVAWVINKSHSWIELCRNTDAPFPRGIVFDPSGLYPISNGGSVLRNIDGYQP